MPALDGITTIDIASYEGRLVLGEDTPRHLGYSVGVSYNENNLEIIAYVMGITIGQFDDDVWF